MTTLTVQIKSVSRGWVDQTIVTIMYDPDGSEKLAQTRHLKSELPENMAARIKVETDNKVSYVW